MQVSFNSVSYCANFKASKNNKTANSATLNNQISFGDSYNSHTQKNKFKKLIEKICINNNNKKQSIKQVIEVKLSNKSADETTDAFLVKYYGNNCGIDPNDALFITNYVDNSNRQIVVFNAFSIDENDNEKMQLFVIESNDSKLNSTQKAAFKMFYDDQTRNKLARGSRNNPLKDIKPCDYSKDTGKEIKRIAKSIQNYNWAKYCANASQLDSVIFSTDGSKKYWFNPKNI